MRNRALFLYAFNFTCGVAFNFIRGGAHGEYYFGNISAWFTYLISIPTISANQNIFLSEIRTGILKP